MNRTCRAHGYTLLELFIAILIIGVILALVLPAIQASREAARRTQCNNNLKNITLSLQNYHDTYKVFPMGVMHSGKHPDGDPPNDGKLGPSWWYGILPFVEQTNVYDGIQGTQRSRGLANNQFCASDMIAAGVAQRDKSGTFIAPFGRIVPDYMRCPSSPLPMSETATGPICLPSYVGIAGGCDIDPKSQDYANFGSVFPPQWRRTYHNKTKGTGAAPGGIVTTSGMLPPCEHVRMADCTNGTNNTMIVAEQSDWLRDRAGATRRRYHGDAGWTVGGTGTGGGWLSGTARCDPVPQVEAPGGPPTPWGADCWNLTMVRYPLDYKHVTGTPSLPGCSENHGINNPLQSPHPGVVLLGMVDGSVQPLSSSTELSFLLRLAIRNNLEEL